MKYNILVTGCGGDIGQSIGKILKKNSYLNKLFGCDISDENAGKFIFDNFFIAPRCTEPNYLDFISEYIKENEIDFVIPIAEPELRFLSEKGITSNIGAAKLIMASARAQNIGFDKMETANFLKTEGLPYPETSYIDEVNFVEKFPIILKSAVGSGSSKVFKVMDKDEFLFYKKHNPDFIVQEFLDGRLGEFTCGLFRSKSGDVRSIILKRQLMGGFSGYGEVVAHEEISKLLNQIAEKIELVGSINVQLRLTEKGPIVFEINPRFSSTVLFRDMLGYNDLIWSIEDMADLKISSFINDSVGKKFYKGFAEYISNK